MSNYADFQQRVWRALGDPNGKTYTEETVYDAAVAAHDAILPWVPKFSLVTYTSGSSPAAYPLPVDCYAVETVQEVDTGLFIPRATLAPKTTRNIATYANNDWVEYPSGILSLSTALATGSQIRLFYRALWNMPSGPSDTAFVLEVPRYAQAGMVFYACSYTLLYKGVKSGNLRQFNTRQDSGNPEDNPLEDMSDVFLRRFYAEMKSMPPYVKVSAA